MHKTQLSEQNNASFLKALYFIIFLFFVRFLDVFLIRSDEWFGEQVLTKIVGIICVFLYLQIYRLPFRTIGLTNHQLRKGIFWGTAIILIALIAGYTSEWLFLFLSKQNPKLYINPQGNSLIPETIVSGSFTYAAILIAGNIINSLMEESFFRGFLLFQFQKKFSIKQSIIIQGIFFGMWHIFWPIRDFLTGKTDVSTFIAICLIYCSISTIIGIAWGILYWQTKNLWTVIIAHTLNNSVLNLLHITTNGGTPNTIGIRTTVLVFVFFAITLLLVKRRQKQISETYTN